MQHRSRTGPSNRIVRVAAEVRRILAGPIGELARARSPGLVTVTDVELSPDLRHGTVYLSVYGDVAARRDFMDLVAGRAASLQATVAHALRTKRTPVLAFRLDDTLERGDRIHRLLEGEPSDAAQ